MIGLHLCEEEGRGVPFTPNNCCNRVLQSATLFYITFRIMVSVKRDTMLNVENPGGGGG